MENLNKHDPRCEAIRKTHLLRTDEHFLLISFVTSALAFIEHGHDYNMKIGALDALYSVYSDFADCFSCNVSSELAAILCYFYRYLQGDLCAIQIIAALMKPHGLLVHSKIDWNTNTAAITWEVIDA